MKPFQFTFLQISILISILFLGVVISPFLTMLIIAAVLVTGTYPIYKWLLQKMGERKGLSALIMSLSIGVVFSLAFFVFIILLSQEAVSTYIGLEGFLRSGQFNINELAAKASGIIGIPPVDIISSITSAAQTLSGVLVTQSTNLIRSVGWLILNFFFLVFAMYFFFKDGQAIVHGVETLVPLPKTYGHEILQKFRQVSIAMLYGIFFTAIIQGFLGGIGLAFAGVHNPIFWGTLMGLFGMIPIVGTGIIWLPAGLYLILAGNYIQGIGLLLWGGLIVAFVDNIVKPIIISKQTRLYPLGIFLVVIGGLIVFGLKGAIIAPMVLALLVALIHIYRLEERPEAS